MSVSSESPPMNVLINLSSRLLCEALQWFMEKSAGHRARAAFSLDQRPGFIPDKILVDAATLEHLSPADRNAAKIILIDTGLGEDEVIRLVFQHRLDGVISTSTGTGLFWKALETIHSGQIWIDNSKLRAMLYNPPAAGTAATPDSYSKRERQIVLLVAEGRTNRDIAAQLIISEQTVKTHISRILNKAGATSRVQLAPLALKFKLEASPLAAPEQTP